MTNDFTPPSTEKELETLISRKMMDIFIRVGLIGFLVFYCYQIFKPFIGLILWSVILAVALHPLQALIAAKMGGRQGRASTVLVLAILLGVLVPTTLLAISFADTTTNFVKEVQNGTFHVPEPNKSVAGWPVVGEKLYGLWESAHNDLGSVLAKLEPKISPITKTVLGYAASVGGAILIFVVSLSIAGVLMAFAESGHATAKAIARRMAGEERGFALVALSTSTIRAVAQGVIGIACVQSLLLGAGFIMVGIPGAGILALLVLLLGVMQIPASLVALPAIIYVFSTNESTTVSVMFTVYSIVAGSVDNVLKPFVLGRGVDAPMPVILLGALGGMASGGIIGLFVGAVLLALGYQIFMAWVHGEGGQIRPQEAVEPAQKADA